MKKTLTVALIIPVYNEQRHIGACLDAISRQTVMPDEVIVVDNNCTDESMEIARRYPFVKIVTETRQGRGNAREAGFAASTSDIIGRIDADSVIDENWVEIVRSTFDDQSIHGVTGVAYTRIIPHVEKIYATFWSRVYFWLSHMYFGALTLWGANMAIRRTAWERVREHACLDDTLVHEDIDLSILMLHAGNRLIQENSLRIRTSGQSYIYLPKFLHYLRLIYATKSRHRRLGNLSFPTVSRVNRYSAVPGLLLSVIPSVLFVLMSIASWPFDRNMVGKNRPRELD